MSEREREKQIISVSILLNKSVSIATVQPVALKREREGKWGCTTETERGMRGKQLPWQQKEREEKPPKKS